MELEVVFCGHWLAPLPLSTLARKLGLEWLTPSLSDPSIEHDADVAIVIETFSEVPVEP